MERIYLDYNATSPFAYKVLDFLSKGDFPFANPASIHSSGKSAAKLISETTSFLSNNFGIKHRVFYHSGATEGINTFIKSLDTNYGLFIFSTDHPCVHAAAFEMEKKGLPVVVLSVNAEGNFDYDLVRESLLSFQQRTGKKTWINYTYVNNETGVIWPLDVALKLKNETGCLVHVDAVQSIGKIKNWNKLEQGLDVYTYSAHKFGGMKGVGFSFFNKEHPLKPLISGGGQQDGLRAGTENVLGVYSIKLALEEILNVYSFDTSCRFQQMLCQSIVNLIGDRVTIAGSKSTYGRATNLLSLVFSDKTSDALLINFDLAGIDVSSGSACSVGALKPSTVITAMGYGNLAKNVIRLSWGADAASHKTISERLTQFFSSQVFTN